MTKARIKKKDLKLIFDNLKDSYRIIGPKNLNDVVTLTDIDFNDIPSGYTDTQGPGAYRLNPPIPPSEGGGKRGFEIEGNGGSTVFSFSSGPDSFKRFLNPPFREILTFKKSTKGISAHPSLREEKPLAFIGMRACDMAGLRLLDKVFLEGPVMDTQYNQQRKSMIIIAVNCIHPNDNCFCASMGTGPEIKDGFDIAITELNDFLLLEIVTSKGKGLMQGLSMEEAGNMDTKEKNSKIEDCRKRIKKSIRASELPWLIYRNLEHPRWTDTADRCLACGSCTQVCPTCFCNSTFDCLQLSGITKKSSEISGSRIRTWDSCFSKNFARVHGGNFRASRKSRYRHWMAHKLAYWMDEFGSPGCVGCGRCITWCPVGIDITEEMEALRK